jgi:TonB family protein
MRSLSILSALLATLMSQGGEAQVGSGIIAPRPIYSPDPEYSNQARNQRVQGICVLRVVVGTDGVAHDIRVEKALGAGLDENAIAAVRRWRFEPAVRNGRPIAAKATVEVSFRLAVDEEAQELLRAALPPAVEFPISTRIEPCPESATRLSEPTAMPQVTVAEVAFEGAFQVPFEERTQIAASIEQSAYGGTPENAMDEVSERVREAWQNRGYFDVQVSGESKVLSSIPMNSRIAVEVRIDEGRQYRLGGITFRNNRAITNVQALRDLFPIKDGDIASREKIAQGLENLRKAYKVQGYVNVTIIPEPHIEDDGLVSFDVDVDEGKQFVVGSINLIGEDANVLEIASKQLLFKIGQVYNQNLIDLFEKNYPSAQNGGSETDLHLNERNGTADITLDVRNCQSTAQ